MNITNFTNDAKNYKWPLWQYICQENMITVRNNEIHLIIQCLFFQINIKSDNIKNQFAYFYSCCQNTINTPFFLSPFLPSTSVPLIQMWLEEIFCRLSQKKFGSPKIKTYLEKVFFFSWVTHLDYTHHLFISKPNLWPLPTNSSIVLPHLTAKS